MFPVPGDEKVYHIRLKGPCIRVVLGNIAKYIFGTTYYVVELNLGGVLSSIPIGGVCSIFHLFDICALTNISVNSAPCLD